MRDELVAALSAPFGPRELPAPVRSVAARVTAADLRSLYPRIIVVDRESFTLRLYKNLRLARTYPIAVGMIGLQTPAGVYNIQDKQVGPWWAVPDDAWAGSLHDASHGCIRMTIPDVISLYGQVRVGTPVYIG